MNDERQEQQELDGIAEPVDESSDEFGNGASDSSTDLPDHEELVDQADRLESLHGELESRLSGNEDPNVS